MLPFTGERNGTSATMQSCARKLGCTAQHAFTAHAPKASGARAPRTHHRLGRCPAAMQQRRQQLNRKGQGHRRRRRGRPDGGSRKRQQSPPSSSSAADRALTSLPPTAMTTIPTSLVPSSVPADFHYVARAYMQHARQVYTHKRELDPHQARRGIGTRSNNVRTYSAHTVHVAR